jgi:hypothetical protein
MTSDNWKLDTTPYDLQVYQIKDPTLFKRVEMNNLKVGGKYRYCFTENTYPECVTIISNEGDDLVITNPYVHNGGGPWKFKKSETVKSYKNIFYEKNYYSCRENYLKLKEGLILPKGKCSNHICHYLFDDENIIKEISSYQPRIINEITEILQLWDKHKHNHK